MACRFCPKIKRLDFLWMIIMCLAIWWLDKHQNHKSKLEVDKIRVEEDELRKTRELQKSCMFGDQKACDKVYGENKALD